MQTYTQATSSFCPTVFQFKESHSVRVQIIAQEPWFCLADVCETLSVDRTSRLLRDLDIKGMADCHIPTNGGQQSIKFISEPNLYRVIFRSNKSEAKEFQSWIFTEVLPSIRKNGRYEDPNNKLQTLIGKTIGTDGFHVLGALIAGKVKTLPTKLQRSATMKMWSQLHVAYGVRSAESIPADQLDSARNLVAAYALEGEYIQGGSDTYLDVNYPSSGTSFTYEFTDMMNCGWTTQMDKFLHLLKQHTGKKVTLHISDISQLQKEFRSLQHLTEIFSTRLEKVRTAALFAADQAKISTQPASVSSKKFLN